MIARLNQFHALPSRGEDLRHRMTSIVSSIAESDGCLSVTLLRSQDDPDQFVIYEVWESVAHHEGAAQVIPPDMIASTVAMLATAPTGQYLSIEATQPDRRPAD